MDIDSLLERYTPVLSQKDLSFDEKVGFITGRETANATLSPENVLKTAKTVRNLLLGNLNRRMNEMSQRQREQEQAKRMRPTKPAKPQMTRAEMEQEIQALSDKMRIVDFSDEHAGQNLQLWGKRLNALKEKLAHG